MKIFTTLTKLLLAATFLLMVSCQENNKERVTEMDLLFSSLQTDQAKWWRYHKTNIDLTADFAAHAEDGNNLSKKAFFEALLTGDYIAIEKDTPEDTEHYQLFKLTEEADEDISYTIIADSYRQYKHFAMEGTELPGFNFTDLDGKTWTKEELKGKTLVVKTWFIRCKPCIEEMPQLNQSVEDYSDREDVVFLSLALDPEDELRKFLSEKEFTYAVVPSQKTFIEDSLGLSIYPTHILVAPSGKIRKVVNSAPEMIAALKGLPLEVKKNGSAPPPPPPPGS
ncbi:TlpA family protein disulfide reductase [Salinimicrobium oceani]|uniref:TlpA family protein disulfide reductase n=1 Tax=Salinimicrobium oceani TaxID=2722702 RepID=A0ABX1CWK0_9FLAO|nr:TlpA disulfide reductase family protein [Salinimicrobium oceani]NJW51527.1 TlpA family protein disulfide reductase [Salinimicrobium oceani]